MKRTAGLTGSARLGLFAVGALIFAVAAIYLFSNFGAGRGTYRTAVHFGSAAGLPPGARVYMNGVAIGTVSKVRILPDGSVDVEMAIESAYDIPKNSRISIRPTFTSSPDVVISAGSPGGGNLPKHVVPVAEQPVGYPPMDIQALLVRAQGVAARGQLALAIAQRKEPAIFNHAMHARSNLTGIQSSMRTGLTGTFATLQSTMIRARAQMYAAQAALQRHDSKRAADMASAFSGTAASLDRTMSGVRSASHDPIERANLRAIMRNMSGAMQNLSATTAGLQAVAGDPQARAQLRDAALHLQAAKEKALSFIR